MIRDAETAQNVSAPTIFRHLYTSKRSVDLFIVQAKMGPRNLFIWWAQIVQQFEERSLSKRFTETPLTSKTRTYLSYSSPAFKQCGFSERTEQKNRQLFQCSNKRVNQALYGGKLWTQTLAAPTTTRFIQSSLLGKRWDLSQEITWYISFNLNDLFVFSTHSCSPNRMWALYSRRNS